MVDNENSMSMEDLDQLIADTPPGTPAPETAPPESNSGNSSASENNGDSNGNTDNQDSNEENSNESGAGGTEEDSKHNANQAFAEMRIKNQKMTRALQAVLQQHGLDPSLASNPEKLIADAEDARLEAEAKKQNVPTDLLKRLTQLEQDKIEQEHKRLTDLALQGFQNVKNKYNLTPKDISDFARQLQEAGTNPFEKEMDLELHYKLHNMDKIIAAEKQKAVEEALRNQSNAAQHSTAPNKSQGKETSGVDKIDTMAQFDRFLANLNK